MEQVLSMLLFPLIRTRRMDILFQWSRELTGTRIQVLLRWLVHKHGKNILPAVV